ncbi:MAG: hypothetical protein RLZZ399_2651 [Verrucomicrobiota bacterium]
MRFTALPRLFLSTLAGLSIALSGHGKSIPFFDSKRKDPLPAAPPLPAPLTLSVERNQTLLVPLRVIGPQTEPVRFLLRAKPEHGTATLLKTQPGSEALVEYRPPSDRSISRDRFSFAAANSNGFSSEAFVQIQITDRSGKVELPARLEFPKARVGFISQQTLLLRNTGDAPVSGTIALSPGWSASVDHYALEAQTELSLQISVQPTAPGSLHGSATFSHAPQSPIQLQASVEEWIDAAPDPLVLAAVPGSKTRSGTLHLTNSRPASERVKLESSPALLHPEEITVEPGETLELPIRSQSSQSEPFEGTLRLVRVATDPSPMPHRILVWRAEAIGSSLRVMNDLSQPLIIPADPKLFTPLSLQNDGGREGSWSIHAPPAFVCEPSSLSLLPGKWATVKVATQTTPTERTEDFLEIRGANQTLRIPLVSTPDPRSTPREPNPIAAQKPAPNRSSSRASAARSRQTSSPPADSPPSALDTSGLPTLPPDPTEASRGSAPADPQMLRLLQRAYHSSQAAIRGSRLSEITDRSALLEIPMEPGASTQGLLLQILKLEPDPDHNLQVRWENFPHFRVHSEPSGRVHFRLQNLAPDTTYTLRLLGEEFKNGRRPVLHQCEFTTSPPRRISKFLLLTLAASGGAWFGFTRWKKHRSRRP